MNKYNNYLALGLLGLIAGCSDQVENTSTLVPIVQVKTLTPYSLEHEDTTLYYPAVLEARDRAELSFRAGGKVISLYVSEGDLVKQGQLLAELEPSDFQLNVKNTYASFAAIDQQFTRSHRLVKQGMLAQSQFDEITARRRFAKAEYELAKLRLSFSQLIAPRDGVISRVHVERHENVKTGQPIVNIHDSENIDVTLQVADQVIAHIPHGIDKKSVRAQVKIGSEGLHEANLKEFTSEKNHQTAAYRVTLSMPIPNDVHLFDGMSAEVLTDFTYKGHSPFMTTIPIESVVIPDGYPPHPDNKFVWTLSDSNLVQLKQVKGNQLNHHQLLVTSGLESNETVITGGMGRLRDGMLVKPMRSEAKQ
ncbi:efflux RND transporter periplasmic adaptor subunit [Vibrio comitans]|uniref:Hemolysin secretion protein D n=1 Tax=Vibrio comitans NBRC 102076 TaxID=1219078 RepID=A0A4Y3IH98_9VIBR|nr:efflux RND transporter periplasmic adaptor subunit [Vibrio comitans]GEA58853.1 hemolysin secretion protein D [Vibrio comitans NBRC 102076]